MQSWEWEIFEQYVGNRMLEVIDSGPLFHPIKEFKISRDTELDLIIHTRCDANAATDYVDHPAGTVRINTESVKLKSYSDTIITVGGVQPIKSKRITNYVTNKSELQETSSAHEISGCLKKNAEAKFIIEWVANIENNNEAMWPDIVTDEIKTSRKRTLSGDKEPITISSISKSSNSKKNCIKLQIDGINFHIGTCASVDIDSSKFPGFILYSDIVSEEIRRKIRGAASFVFGKPIIYLGETSFNQKWEAIYFKAVSPNSMNGKAFSLHGMPLSPLKKPSEINMNNKMVSKMIEEFYRKHDDYDLLHISWLYWYACISPAHIAASQFGATLEAILRAYVEKHKSSFKKCLLDEANWMMIKNELMGVLSKIIDETSDIKEAKEVLKNKIENLNHSPQSQITKQFFKLINLELTKNEEKVFKQRNKSAHGGKTANSDNIKFIKEVKILRLFCNRILLKIFDASEYYVDYHTSHYPVKRIEDPILL